MEIRFDNLFFSFSKKILMFTMKIFICLFSFFSFALSSEYGFSQNTIISIEADQTVSIDRVFKIIKKQTDYNFAYSAKLFKNSPKVNLKKGDILVDDLLNTCLSLCNVDYYFLDNNTIILEPSEDKMPESIVQEYLVKGTVKDEEGNPIPYASVAIEGTNRGVASDDEGRFQLKVTDLQSVLVISSLGYETQKVVLNNTTNIDVVLVISASQLEEVMVYGDGYSKISKERSTGSYGSVSENVIKNSATQTIGSMLEGIAPGIQVVEDADGNIDASEVTIRGIGSMESNTTPLVVVDGFPISGGFSTINPNDVESVTILKDAAAASIWGARAGNGVIVVTTKRNKTKEKLQINFSSFIKMRGKTDLDYNLNKASAASELEAERRMYQVSGTALRYVAPEFPSSQLWEISYPFSYGTQAYNDYEQGKISENELNQIINRLKQVNMYDDIEKYMLTNPVHKQYNLSVATANEKSNSRFSVLYNDNINSFINDENDQLLLNLNNQYKVADWLTFDFGAMLDRSNKRHSDVDLETFQEMSAYEKLVNEDGSYAPVISDLNLQYLNDFTANVTGLPYQDLTYNPLREARNSSYKTKSFNYRIATGLTFDILEGLTFKTNFQYENFKSDERILRNENTYFARLAVTNGIDYNSYDSSALTVDESNLPKGGILDLYTADTESYTFRNLLTFDRTIATDHNINLLMGTEILSSTTKQNGNRIYGFDEETNTFKIPTAYRGWSNIFLDYRNGATNGLFFSERNRRFLSYFGNIAYTYKDKYTVTASARSDGANYIVKDPSTRYNPMWSLGLSWNAKRESLFRDVEMLDQLKFRATLGENGNVVSTASTVPIIELNAVPSARTGAQIASILDMGNPDLRWERFRTLNLGADFSLWDRKLYGAIDVYNKQSRDLIAQVSIPSTLGSTSQIFNVAEMTNKGVELNLNSDIPFAQGGLWNTNVSFAHNDSEVTKLFISNMSPRFMDTEYIEGHPYNSIFSFVYDGMQEYDLGNGETELYPTILGENGVKYRFDENIGRSNGEDGRDVRKFMGTYVAPTIIGWNNTISYKGFTLRTRVVGKFGHKFVRPTYGYATSPMKWSVTSSSHSDLDLLIEGKENQLGLPPLHTTDDFYGYRWRWYIPLLDTLVEDAAHIRLREIYLAYNLPRQIFSKTGITNLRLFTQVENLGNIWTANKFDIDPEYVSGVTRRPEKTFTLGLNIEF